MSNIVCLFSCGAASACATKIILTDPLRTQNVIILNNEVVEEHPDNKRFLADCEEWFDYPIHTVRNEKYHGSIYEVFQGVNFLKGFGGAPCTRLLKREIRDQYLEPNDTLVLGFTSEEQDRLDRFIDANNGRRVRAPLIEKGMNKADCLGLLEREKIDLPAMYLLGYHNNNCIGCVKGAKGYWNKIRVDFPEVFERMAREQDRLGPGSYFWAGKKKGDPRISLRELPADAGRYEDEPDIQCGAACELVEIEIKRDRDDRDDRDDDDCA